MAASEAREVVVVSGMSGRFPECDSVAEFKTKLFAGEDMVTLDRRQQDLGSWGAPKYAAMLNSLDKFDSEFFGIHANQVPSIDPQARIVLEAVHEAIIDSGQNPQQLRGSKTAVFVGISFSDSEQYWSHQCQEQNPGRYLLGNSDALVANRISYIFDFKGPSAAIDTGCSSSMHALEAAVSSIRSGGCDAAVVAATNISLNPLLSAALSNTGALNQDGRCKVFDRSADGYTRAEAVVVVILQRSADARRRYAEVVGVRVNSDGFKAASIMSPSAEMQEALMRDAYLEAGVDPARVCYVEAHGTGTQVGDPRELRAVAQVFCNNRTSPLLVGSVKSNMGHSEAASGLCSLVKVILAFESRHIPPNLHFREPNERVPQLVDGRIKVVTELTALPGDLVAVNSFGFGGSNAHMILRRPASSATRESSGAPKVAALVGVSGRTEEAVRVLLDAVETQDFNEDLVALLNSVHGEDIPRHPYRGYITRSPGGRTSRVIQECGERRKEVWFVFSGLGSHSPGMARQLMDIPAFKDVVDRCSRVVEGLGVDLHAELCSERDSARQEFCTTFLAIIAVQLGVFEVLKAAGVTPDRIVGSSLGEHAAGYADGCLTLEQAVMGAYHRGLVSDQLRGSGGSMAVVGLPAETVEAMSPAGAVVACDNGPHQVTVSGSEPAVRQLVEEARRLGAPVCEMDTGGVAFHSLLVRPAHDELLARLRQVISEPKRRSARWLSSSVPRAEWGSPAARECSAEYLAHNYISPALFRDACRDAAPDAVMVELAPHALLLPALTPTLGPAALAVPMLTRNSDAVTALTTALGRLFVSGVPVKLAALFPSPALPVRPGTAMLSPLVKWDHTTSWFVPSFSNKTKAKDVFVVDINTPKYEWCRGHQIDGRIIFPATGYLVIVWETLAARQQVPQESLAVCFSDVMFHHATVLDDRVPAELTVGLLNSGVFEVTVAGVLAASGKVSACPDSGPELVDLPPGCADQGCLSLDSRDVYSILRLRGYHYTGQFAGVLCLREGVGGTVRNNGNWVPLLDTILQVALLQHLQDDDSSCLHLPTKFRRVLIDPAKFKQAGDELLVRTCARLGVTECRGVQFCDVTTTSAPRRRDNSTPRTDDARFVPRDGFVAVDVGQAVSLCVQTVLENWPSIARGSALRVAEIQGGEPVLPLVAEMLALEPLVKARLTFVASCEVSPATRGALEAAGVAVEPLAPGDDHLVIAHRDPGPAVGAVGPGGFLAVLGDRAVDGDIPGLRLVAEFSLPAGARVSLYRNHEQHTRKQTVFKLKNEDNFQWVDDLKNVFENVGDSDLLIVSEGDPLSGIVGFINCLRREPGVPFIRYVAVLDKEAPQFSLQQPLYEKQLALGLASNVLKGGKWGGYRFLRPRPRQGPRPRHEHVQAAGVVVERPGDLASLRWTQHSDTRTSSNDEKGALIQVCYSALNFRDVMIATGRLPEECALGLEVSGLTDDGARVMAIVQSGGLSTSLRSNMVWQVPQLWTLQEAATVPVAYATAYYSLMVRGQMRPGQSVLIHSGSGGVGQAAIAISLHMRCAVFTTVGTHDKKVFLKTRFPQLELDNIGNSRDESFYNMVMTRTSGRGVDLVLNSLAGEKLQSSVRCLADNGHFLEIGKFDMYADKPLGLRAFLKNITFHGINLLNITSTDRYACDQIQALLTEGLSSDVVKPLPSTVFESDQVEAAFRYMAAGNHIGKVLVRVADEGHPPRVLAQPRLSFSHSEFVIVTGGLGGLGLELCDLLVSRGARHLVIASRKGAASAHQALRLRRWRAAGVQVLVSAADATTPAGAAQLVRQCSGTVVAIFHLAAVLSDGLMRQQTADTFSASWRPKASMALCVDLASRKLCPHLRMFVCFSSAAAGFGNPGQTNYGLASSSLERIVECRVMDGLPGLAVQWGPIADVGLAADLSGVLESSGVAHQSVASFLETLECLVVSGRQGVVTSVVVSKQPRGNARPAEHLFDMLSKTLNVPDIRKLPPETKLVDLGMDSLMQAEVRTCIERHCGWALSPAEMTSVTVGRMLRLVQEEPRPMRRPPASDELDEARRFEDALQLAYSAPTPGLPLDVVARLAGRPASSGRRALFLVHPMDGRADSLRELAAKISCPVYCLQFTREAPRRSLSHLATFYLQKIRCLQPESPYHLGGYSMGVMIALEMALQLQEAGEQAHLVSLDGLPSIEKLRRPHVLAHIETRYLLNAASTLCSSVDTSSLEEELVSVLSWTGKLDRCLAVLGDQATPEELEQTKEAMEAYHWRVKACAEHQWRGDGVLEGRVLVVVAKEGFVQTEDSPDTSFSKVSTGRVDVIRVDGGHVSFICGEVRCSKVAGHINSWLASLLH